MAIDRACKLFNCKYANVQPHSGAQANEAVYNAILKPGDVVMGMSINSGGHISHFSKATAQSRFYNVIQYEVNPDTFLIDYDELEIMINQELPRLFIAGASAYPREIDFKRIKEIINNANKRILDKILDEGFTLEELDKEYEKRKIYFMVDMSHIAGLVAAGYHQSPIEYSDVITTTTHKTLRGTRGGLILTNNEDLIKKINKGVFPNCQGGPLEHIIAAKAVTFGEALKPEFKEYIKNVIENAQELAAQLKNYDINILTDGTDNHLLLIDLRKENISGAELEKRLENVGIIVNKNAVPFDTKNKKTTSGIRIGTPAITSRGLVKDDMAAIAKIIAECIHTVDYEGTIDMMKEEVNRLCKKYPLYED